MSSPDPDIRPGNGQFGHQVRPTGRIHKRGRTLLQHPGGYKRQLRERARLPDGRVEVRLGGLQPGKDEGVAYHGSLVLSGSVSCQI